ncbi:Gfo/Idh/MocA family oxidoreductase [Nocardia uniformis]|uniref:Gfo/Idh/MocA family oxidoreductase n=1 Tax=Nocardia uniformis TaxID=53432 RepID=A0A849C0Y5_9NOCA|nr:Gfo/Idh/MocA family oxidoreductase [Nocardia uniformis]NNH68659.1 Gfo/Idh/MocA family oxidoreductase [Nocardia uniformis]
MKIALLGTGFGQAHAAVFASRDDVEVIVFGRTPAALERIHDSYGFATSTDLDSLYDDPTIDLIDICLPTALHAEHVQRGLAAGKHVLCELPLALSMADARRVADAAAASDRQVFVDMFDRFSPVNRILFEATRSGTYGRLLELELELRTALLWPGYDLGLDSIALDAMHGDLDVLTRVLGVPETVSAIGTAGAQRGSAAYVTLTYPNAVARVSASSLMPDPYGSRGGFRATFTDGVLEHRFGDGRDADSAVIEYSGSGTRTLKAEGPQNYAAMIDHVLTCLRGETENEIAPSSVLDTLALTLDIHAAIQQEPR